ncbi:MAG: DUF2309 domain-containing protein [Nitrospira sp.]|nr:MAG: DUF2309 domain-containing protein [Nitrospira sp.]
MNGDVPYHEPMRLLTVVAAPRERIEKLITRHERSITIATIGSTSSHWNRKKVYSTGIDRRTNGLRR